MDGADRVVELSATGWITEGVGDRAVMASSASRLSFWLLHQYKPPPTNSTNTANPAFNSKLEMRGGRSAALSKFS
jgi:hypothetical protein